MNGLAPANIAAHLPEMAARLPDAVALHLPQRRRGQLTYRSVTFAELEAQSNRYAHALEGCGIGRGVRTALMVPPGLEFLALTFALFKVGAVPVLIDPGMGVKNLKTCLAEAAPEAFIGVPKAHLARLLFGWGKGSLRRLVTVGRRFGWGGKTLAEIHAAAADRPYPLPPTAAATTAAILFTSGSTGVPKGAVYSHGNFAAQVAALRDLYGIAPGEVDLPTFPLFALFAPALGMSAVIPEMDFTRPATVDAEKLVAAVQRFGVSNMFGSPALIDRVGRYGLEKGVRMPSLRRVISAGAPVPAKVLERFVTLLGPEAEIFTPYGATEALPVCSIGSRTILGETRRQTERGAGVCVGRPVSGIRVEIIAIGDAPITEWHDGLRLPDGEIGEIVVQGAQVTAAYFHRPEATALAKIVDPAGGFFHRMGDLGYRDGQGRIWFCGRKAHRVVTVAGTLFSIPCEAIFNTHRLVYRSALVGIGASGNQRPVICIETEAGVPVSAHARLRGELRKIAESHPVTAGIRDILFHPAFPVDIRHNAKIFREKLARWAAKELR